LKIIEVLKLNNIMSSINPPSFKTKKQKPIPLLKDKKAMEEIKADPKQVLSFFANCIKKPKK